MFRPLVAGLGASIVAAIVAAIALTLLDLYLTGHQLGSISGPWIEWPSLGVHMSPADVALLAIAILAGVIAARAARRTS